MLRKISVYIFFLIIILTSAALPQSMRELVNKGVDFYKEGRMTDAEVNFKKGIEKAPKNYIANFNLGDAYYKEQRFDEAIKSYQKALAESKTANQKAQVYHNIGNSLLKDKKIDESIEAYKQALKLNPGDAETKYNLSYALSQKNNQQNKKQNQDKNKNDKNNKDNKNKQDNKGQNKNNQNGQNKNQNRQDQNKQDQQKQQQPQNRISKADAERILNALKNNEKDLQKKLRKINGKAVKTDKDW